MEELTHIEKRLLIIVLKEYANDLPDKSMFKVDIFNMAEKLEKKFFKEGEYDHGILCNR